MTDETYVKQFDLKCQVCNGESGGKFVGVASIPGAPMSIAWCDECLKRDSAPDFVFEHDFIFVAGGDSSRLSEWARQRVTWADGKYVSFDDFVKRFDAAYVAQALREYEIACGAGDGETEVPPDDPRRT